MEARKPTHIAGLILAGGRSTRMGGRQKTGLRDGEGIPFLERQLQALSGLPRCWLSLGADGSGSTAGLTVIPDELPDQGPLGGILSALKQTGEEALLVAACDMPFLTRELVDWLAGYEEQNWPCWCVQTRSGRLQPLFGVYRRSCIPVLEAMLQMGEHRVRKAFAAAGGVVLPMEGTDFPDSLLENINTPAELERLLRRN